MYRRRPRISSRWPHAPARVQTTVLLAARGTPRVVNQAGLVVWGGTQIFPFSAGSGKTRLKFDHVHEVQDFSTMDKDINGIPQKDTFHYWSQIGQLNYLTQLTQSDLQYAIHQCARFRNDPKHSHEVAAKRIVQYLKGHPTKESSFVFDWNGLILAHALVDNYQLHLSPGTWFHLRPRIIHTWRKHEVLQKSKTVLMTTSLIPDTIKMSPWHPHTHTERYMWYSHPR